MHQLPLDLLKLLHDLRNYFRLIQMRDFYHRQGRLEIRRCIEKSRYKAYKRLQQRINR